MKSSLKTEMLKNAGFTFSAIFLKGLSHGIICVSQTFSNIWSLKPSPNSLQSLEILPISECLHRVLKHARNRPTSPSCFHGSRGRGSWYTPIFVQPETVTALHWDTCFTAEPKSKLNEKVYWPSGKCETPLTCLPFPLTVWTRTDLSKRKAGL